MGIRESIWFGISAVSHFYVFTEIALNKLICQHIFKFRQLYFNLIYCTNFKLANIRIHIVL